MDGSPKEALGSGGRAAREADVVIVGAGPAGCAAAADLLAAGLRVLLLERPPGAGAKPCAGGLTIKAVRALGYPIDHLVRHTSFSLTVSRRQRSFRRLSGPAPVCQLVHRPELDRYCLERVRRAGAALRRVGSLGRIEEQRRGVHLVVDGRPMRCGWLIGADGVFSRVRRLTGRFPGIRLGFALEGRVPAAAHTSLALDFDQVPGGYGWVFPKGDHLNVGLYTCRPGVRLDRSQLVAYAARRLAGARPAAVRGYPLGLGGWDYRPGRGRVLLAGDAAGLVDPLLGEGLYHAIVSGQAAAAAIARAVAGGYDAGRGYARELVAIRRELMFARVAAALFYGLPAAGQLLLTAPPTRIALMGGFAGGLGLAAIFLGAYRFWLGLPAKGKQSL